MKKKSNIISNFISVIIGMLFLFFAIFDILGFTKGMKDNSFFWVLGYFGLEGNTLTIVSFVLGLFFIYPIFKMNSKNEN